MFVRGDISILVPYHFRSVVAILTAPAVRGDREQGRDFPGKGNYQGDCAMYLQYNANLVHIVSIVCMSC